MSESRPINCRNALRDAGKAYPKSGCAVCGDAALFGCPYNNTPPAERPTPDVKPMGAVTICRNGYIEYLERQIAEAREQRDALATALRDHQCHYPDASVTCPQCVALAAVKGGEG